jgi:hypothetical protein
VARASITLCVGGTHRGNAEEYQMSGRVLGGVRGGKIRAKQIAAATRTQRGQRLFHLKAKREPLIPDSVLKRLTELNLPPNPWVYEVCLRELVRGSP